ncbi:MAG: methionyl-tRNA formyltransferase [Acidimicrobiales bacterium]|nr:methionyl-tRNA formyltransferase [Hyphomonadaceae bacterium]RZV42069.1 MAG: methionyl-tRNA formyltransferase [Acidimicrobiales bacterium]
MRLVFMGTPDFAVPSLSEILASGYDVVRVYTQPPQRAGRGKQIRKSPVHQFAEIMGLPVETPENFRKSNVIDGLEALNADVACVVAYGQILPQRALDAPRLGCLNLHGSKLPRWRGAAPVQRAIMAGDTETAVQIMQMETGLDTGPVLLSETIKIKPDDTAGSLSDRMSRIGAGLWPRTLAALERGGLEATPQSGEPTYAEKINKAESRLDWTKSAQELECHIRGLSPFPGAWCELPTRKGFERAKIHLAKVEDRFGKPGNVLDDELLIACGDQALRLLKLQPAGKGVMNADEYLRGRPCPAGETLS